MVLRISITDSPSGRLVLVEGRLGCDGVPELEGVLAASPAATRLDLSHLRSMDPSGEAALRRMRAAGIELVAIPPGLAWKLDEESP